MPLYEYECKSCEQVIELLVRSQTDQPQCPDCGDKKIERVLSVPSAPSVKNGSSLPVAGGGENCGAPRCCGGGCQM